GRDRDMPPLNTIREGLELPQGQARLQELVKDIIYVIKEYRFQGFHIVGILGKNGSPSCGVTRTSIEGKQAPGEGVFIRVLRQALEAENLDIDIKGIDDHAQEKVIAWVEERI
ncbi:MAG: hypothetical protein U9P14_12095, partial [Gemmatimonadota bacterium]|nr:hypothetical protein [Gemmatimonadota bacterium]